ncbi:nuclear transport factor 2 family protein [Sulfitobacter sp. S223]|uniref:nuclear transport factor 2 family protein n=1 Tax=Sulfitobacter sp. S223 TaxID=2867023 RepID=UPI0021A2A7EA|nr:nuclear transport factor 2 family protein [Sulfitobacter sp. S223]UWR25089.1 nuclear transport factor 2 family protein [Sulfitobacter sp. S223]UWR27940.1 nuclear transport factor 2 family protein [Sulfitobacter sp. S223]
MEDRNTLMALEESLWLANTRFDPDLMDKTFAESFVEFGRSGRRYERAEMIFESTPHAVIDAELPLQHYALELIAPDVALATYTSIVRYGERVERGRRSSIWVKVEGRWKLRFHQGTPY